MANKIAYIALSVLVGLASISGFATEPRTDEEPATVDIITEPSGAEITIGFKPIGESPLKGLTLSAGKYTLGAYIPGLTPIERNIILERGSKTSVKITMEKEKRERRFNARDFWLGVGFGAAAFALTVYIIFSTGDWG